MLVKLTLLVKEKEKLFSKAKGMELETKLAMVLKLECVMSSELEKATQLA